MAAMSVDQETLSVAAKARGIARQLQAAPSSQKNACLEGLSASLIKHADAIVAAAHVDAAHALKLGAPESVIAALQLTRGTLQEKAHLASMLAGLPDPVGRVESTWLRPNGLKIEKIRTPLGVVGVLIEYSPLTVVDAALLCVKAGDALLVHSGSALQHTCESMMAAFSDAELPAPFAGDLVQCVPGHGDTARQALLGCRGWVDLAIPVGSDRWVADVVASAKVPVLSEGQGSCHVYVDADANLDMARRLVADSVGVSRERGLRADTVLIHRDIAGPFAPLLIRDLTTAGISFSGDEALAAIVRQSGMPELAAVRPEGGSVRIVLVASQEEAADVMSHHGAGHSDAIVTENRTTAVRFAALVDSSCLYVNASMRFTDGHQFGMGAHLAISTGRLHARGPIGIDELTTTRYFVTGKGQTVY